MFVSSASILKLARYAAIQRTNERTKMVSRSGFEISCNARRRYAHVNQCTSSSVRFYTIFFRKRRDRPSPDTRENFRPSSSPPPENFMSIMQVSSFTYRRWKFGRKVFRRLRNFPASEYCFVINSHFKLSPSPPSRGSLVNSEIWVYH